MKSPIVINKEYFLQKFPGKGGWTYVAIPEIQQDKSNHFGWVTVSGNIDDYELKDCKLMPMGRSKLFLPVNAAIRKVIKKSEGDKVTVTLYKENTREVGEAEIIECLKDDPAAFKFFSKLTSDEQDNYIHWIILASNDDVKVRRIVKLVESFSKNDIFKI